MNKIKYRIGKEKWENKIKIELKIKIKKLKRMRKKTQTKMKDSNKRIWGKKRVEKEKTNKQKPWDLFLELTGFCSVIVGSGPLVFGFWAFQAVFWCRPM